MDEVLMDEVLMDEVLIDKFCLGFYGYGELCSEYWFVGLEEGGDKCAKEFYKETIKKWDKENPTWPIQDSDLDKGAKELYFDETAHTIQRTWGGLIRLLLSIKNESINREDILNFQKYNLGRKNGNNLLLELLPLPHRNTTRWNFISYGKPNFSSRKDYTKYYTPKRINQIRELIIKKNPKVVVFYSASKKNIKHWKEIIGVEENIELNPYCIIKNGKTIFVVCKHPAAHGITNDYYPELGKNIRMKMG